ncbi:hypothetical protein SXCC_00817 [Gluconacetobacter sp. SXCC-1]|nr:hypothetical protein SXCC_00817 [Gluconacetobacter sp. SXCC-1]
MLVFGLLVERKGKGTIWSRNFRPFLCLLAHGEIGNRKQYVVMDIGEFPINIAEKSRNFH